MFFLVNRFLLQKGFNGITLWPFVFLRSKQLKKDKVFVNHEKIHLKQQAEMLVIPFYIWYGVEFVVRLFQFKNRKQAYRNVSFEREAYAKEKDLDYLKKRSFLDFLKYV